MTKIVLLLIIIVPLISFSQVEKEVSKKLSTQFEELYNAGEYQKIFNLFGSEMQSGLPLEQTIDVLTSLKNQVGKIVKKEFLKYDFSYAVYKTQFEHSILLLTISNDLQARINGLFFKPYAEDTIPELTRNQTKLILPFHGEWTVLWGGDTKELNYHVDNKVQKDAFDILITDDEGKSFKTDGKTLDDYFVFGKEIIAPCDAEVVITIDGIRDNPIGERNQLYIPGNTVVLKTESNEFLFFAHFKQHSIVVKQGQRVKRGELLGLCGNSGSSPLPHLHFQVQNTDDLNKATSAKCFFDKIIVNEELKKDYSPIKGDKIKNE